MNRLRLRSTQGFSLETDLKRQAYSGNVGAGKENRRIFQFFHTKKPPVPEIFRYYKSISGKNRN